VNTKQPHPPAYVCTVCGHEQHRLLQPCEECNSRKLVAVRFMEQQHGEGWRELLRDKGETVN